MPIIDISVPLGDKTPTWPGSTGYNLTRSLSIAAGDSVNNSHLSCDVHTGTHVDAPSHFLAKGEDVDILTLDNLIGPAFVLNFVGNDHITATDLNNAEIPNETQRLLIKTKNSELWSSNAFHDDFLGLTADAAQWIVEHDIKLVGIDYLSIEPFGKRLGTHEILFDGKVTVLEGLDMRAASTGWYELICLPLSLMGVEGAPARAILRN